MTADKRHSFASILSLKLFVIGIRNHLCFGFKLSSLGFFLEGAMCWSEDNEEKFEQIRVVCYWKYVFQQGKLNELNIPTLIIKSASNLGRKLNCT